MLNWIKTTIHTLGYPGIVVLMALENLFPPIPSELIMPLAGFVVFVGDLTFVGVVFAGVIGSVIGSMPLYYVGHRLGADRLCAWLDNRHRWFPITSRDLRRAQRWFERYGPLAVFLCRLVPGIRSLIAIPAGVAHMKVLPFVLYSAIGSAIWSGILAYLGYLLGANYEVVSAYIGPISYVVFGLLGAFLLYKVFQRRRTTAATDKIR